MSTVESRWRIAWRSRITGHTSGGQFILTRAEAIERAVSANSRFPEIEHWAEPEPEEQLEQLN